MKHMKKLEQWFDGLVPAQGPANTVAGEIVRAASRIVYRYENDGDMIGVGYGKETCNAAARYLMENTDKRVNGALDDAWIVWPWCIDDAFYEDCLDDMQEYVVSFLQQNPQLMSTPRGKSYDDYFDAMHDLNDDYEDYE